MNAVGIDVSKGKSTVTIRQPGDVVLMPPRDIPHAQSDINALIEYIRGLDGETKVCMEVMNRSDLLRGSGCESERMKGWHNKENGDWVI